jgi:hypothetical protein
MTDILKDNPNNALAPVNALSNNKGTDGESSEMSVYAFPARVVAVRGVMGLSDEELMTLAESRAADPEIFKTNPPFFWAAEISNSNVDAYFTRMMPSSLKNYARMADEGVAFQNSHNWRELPLGSSLKGKYIAGGTNGLDRVQAAFFTIPGLNPGSLSTDQLILMMRAGTARDVSIGFYGNRSVCSICHGDVWDWFSDDPCIHMPGEMYDVKDEHGVTTDRVMCIENIEDANLAEVSAVYDGACPGAAIMKALWGVESGKIEPEQARRLEARYRIRLPGARHVVPGIGEGNRTTKDPKEEEERSAMAETTDTTQTDRSAEGGGEQTPPVTPPAEQRTEQPGTEGGGGQQEQQRSTAPPPAATPGLIGASPEVRALLARAQFIGAGAEIVADELMRLGREVARLSPLADMGTAYRNDLIEDAIKEGQRAMGKNFSEETYRSILTDRSIEAIKRIRDDFKTQGDKRWGKGRQSKDSVDPNEDRGTDPEVEEQENETRNTNEMVPLTAPASAFRVP